jgi:hypothetical protein
MAKAGPARMLQNEKPPLICGRLEVILEDELCQEFVVRAPSLTTERPQNSWDWYFLMRHSGAPKLREATGLLHWLSRDGHIDWSQAVVC